LSRNSIDGLKPQGWLGYPHILDGLPPL
jgi:hypothetical protein